jgi:hypothetical protein
MADKQSDYKAFVEFVRMYNRFGREKVKALYDLTEEEIQNLEKFAKALVKVKR